MVEESPVAVCVVVALQVRGVANKEEAATVAAAQAEAAASRAGLRVETTAGAEVNLGVEGTAGLAAAAVVAPTETTLSPAARSPA